MPNLPDDNRTEQYQKGPTPTEACYCANDSCEAPIYTTEETYRRDSDDLRICEDCYIYKRDEGCNTNPPGTAPA